MESSAKYYRSYMHDKYAFKGPEAACIQQPAATKDSKTANAMIKELEETATKKKYT